MQHYGLEAFFLNFYIKSIVDNRFFDAILSNNRLLKIELCIKINVS